ncbi:hypothetical protein AC579_9116 [Pseudocercospora musae]|uniref:Uncharacterized protein n=1 Tax=Pseudocercospora musae TaxID=113226 RepID=A0A139IIM5_9PEZI|nr:hypothetical protein AC579_9116 [Pseudocercospora musae]KXT14560.1 hypothetical protein AC579_9116 [Pseudocercospora musae]
MPKLSFLLTPPASSATVSADEYPDRGYRGESGCSTGESAYCCRTLTAPNIGFPIFHNAYPAPKGNWRCPSSADPRLSDRKWYG